MTLKDEFLQIVNEAVDAFPTNRMCQRVDQKEFTMTDYHHTLLMLFHQTFQGPSTFAMAGAHCNMRLHQARDYLLHHADEEKNHWEWVIEDLQNTGYRGPDPRQSFPPTACQSYIAFNVYVAIKHPLSRLAIAIVLESIGASYGKKYAQKICQVLQLKPHQAKFFFGHGDTDVGHTDDLYQILEQCLLSDDDWLWMIHAAKTAGQLYKSMYDEAGRS